jgi:type VI secretion system secreted protein VgrG
MMQVGSNNALNPALRATVPIPALHNPVTLGTLAPLAAPARPVASPPAPAAARSPDELRAHALLAQDVYQDRATPPAGYRVASETELLELGLDASMLQAGDFRARVYVEGSGDDARYVVSMRGTRFESLSDWTTNAQQAFGADSAHYRSALLVGERVGRSELADQVSFTGHSLGGGLASAAAIAAGRPADTFNASGLHGDTIAQGEAIRTANGTTTQAAVQAYYVDGEILSSIQDGGDRVIGGVIGGLVTGGLGGTAVGAALLDLPEAYGTRHEMDAVAPEGLNWFERNLSPMLPIDRHSMDWVLASLPR